MRGLFFAVVSTVVGNWMLAGAATPDMVEHPMSSKTAMVRSPKKKRHTKLMLSNVSIAFPSRSTFGLLVTFSRSFATYLYIIVGDNHSIEALAKD